MFLLSCIQILHLIFYTKVAGISNNQKFNSFDLFNYFAETVGQSNHAAIKPAHNREVDEKNPACCRPLCDQIKRKN